MPEADITDQAARLTELGLAAALRYRKPEARRTGYCLNPRCGEALSNPAAAYCDGVCGAEAARLTALRNPRR